MGGDSRDGGPQSDWGRTMDMPVSSQPLVAADQKIKTVLRLCFHDDFEVSAHATYARAPRRMSDSNFCKDLSDVKRGRIERQIPLFKKKS